MSYQNILVRTEGAVGIVTLNRPQALNALNTALMDELTEVIDTFEADPAIRCVILTGSEKAFAAGADITEMKSKTFAEVYKEDFITKNWERVSRARKPVIAAVAGFALGGGCELAMMCDFIIAADNAKFGQPEINLGLIPGYAGSQRLPRLVGRGRALEMLLTGAQITAEEAHRIGLVNKVVPAASLLTEARALAHTLAGKAPVAVRYILEAVSGGLEMSFADAQDYEATLFGLVSTTDDMREGTRAFLEKRKAAFQGR